MNFALLHIRTETQSNTTTELRRVSNKMTNGKDKLNGQPIFTVCFNCETLTEGVAKRGEKPISDCDCPPIGVDQRSYETLDSAANELENYVKIKANELVSEGAALKERV